MRRRLDIVDKVAAAKRDRDNARLAMRPAREAVILRTLAELADDKLNVCALVRIWREILAMTTRMQTPYTAFVYVPDDREWMWDLARDHFGSLTPLRRTSSPAQAMRMGTTNPADVVVLPMPDDEDMWWRTLAHSEPGLPTVVAKLPFARQQSYPEGASALVIARLDHEPSGDDRAIVLIEAEGGLSRARLRSALETAGLAPNWLAVARGHGESSHHLVEVGIFVEEREPILSNALGSMRDSIRRVVALGGYPSPLPSKISGYTSHV